MENKIVDIHKLRLPFSRIKMMRMWKIGPRLARYEDYVYYTFMPVLREDSDGVNLDNIRRMCAEDFKHAV